MRNHEQLSFNRWFSERCLKLSALKSASFFVERKNWETWRDKHQNQRSTIGLTIPSYAFRVWSPNISDTSKWENTEYYQKMFITISCTSHSKKSHWKWWRVFFSMSSIHTEEVIYVINNFRANIVLDANWWIREGIVKIHKKKRTPILFNCREDPTPRQILEELLESWNHFHFKPGFCEAYWRRWTVKEWFSLHS